MDIQSHSFKDYSFKYPDFNYHKDYFTSDYDTTGQVNLLNGVGTGTDWETRTGRTLTIFSITIRGNIRGNNLATKNGCRTLVLWDKVNKGTTPSITTDILDGTGPLAPFNRYKAMHRFVVLYDNYTQIIGSTATSASTTPTDSTCKSLQLSHDCNGQYKTIYNGTGATAAFINEGALWLVTYGDRAGGTTAALGEFEYIITFNDS